MRTPSLPPFLADILASLARGPHADADGAALARILAGLAAHETEEGGPYAATVGGTRADVDTGINLAVAVFLRRHDVRLPKLDAFLAERLPVSGAVSSPFIGARMFQELLRAYRASDGAVAAGPDADERVTSEEERLFRELFRAADERLEGLSPAFAENARAVIRRTIRGNPDKQMSLMPLYMRQALGNVGQRFGDRRIAELGLANVFFWTAFIVYDDFWDEDEAAEPRLLPVANLFARHYVAFFEHAAPEASGFPAFFHGLMDQLDAANEWEMRACRLKRSGSRLQVPEELPAYGEYDIKFFPAAGHVLGPVAMLLELGYALEGPEVAGLIRYFAHYLVAMQLNDDAHDWKEDLARGHISTVVAKLLSVWKDSHPERKAIDLKKDMPELERLFWFETLAPICESVLAHARQSRAALRALSFVEDPAPLERFVARNERVAQEALAEQRKSVDFLREIA